MYYLGWSMDNGNPGPKKYKPCGIRVCYAESRDGLSWIKPRLEICNFNGSKDNNIILDASSNDGYDNFMVFKDENPACPADERYKGIAAYARKAQGIAHSLWCFVSADGIHFKPGWQLFARTDGLAFDTLNVAFWDSLTSTYHAYMRGFHPVKEDRHGDLNVRDIRHATSKDFKTWTEARRLDFGEEEEDYALYTNVVEPYFRAPHVFVGFPSRYVERRGWTDNYDKLTGAVARRQRMTLHPRYGLVTTDCVFISTRDGQHFQRFNEAFMRPGPETPTNWVYGSCYPARGLVATLGRLSNDQELSFYLMDGHWGEEATVLRRYCLRMDGFASYRASYKPQEVVTKKLVFSGSKMKLNFSTSARGYVVVVLKDEQGKELVSTELFGDATDREVGFTKGRLEDFANKPVTITFRMSDADVYAFKFEY